MSSKYELIDGEKANYPIVRMCMWAGVRTSHRLQEHLQAPKAELRRLT